MRRTKIIATIGPKTESLEMLQKLAGEGARSILMVPISFVSDHVETLYEIDIQYREQAKELGMRLERTGSLNTHPLFIAGLATLVKNTCAKPGWL